MKRDLSDEDLEHIERLQTVRETGAFNMFTDVKDGLEELYSEQEAHETFEWVKDNFEYFRSGAWVGVDT